MRTSWRTEWPHWLLLAGMFGLAAWSWPPAPERIPVHWGLHGQVDRYGGRAVMAAIYALTMSWIHGRPLAIHVWVPAIVGALFVVIGSVLGRVRPNWFVGVRTPWTLSSKVSWERTNRAGGGIGTLGLVVYSYRLWRDDPDKTSPAGS